MNKTILLITMLLLSSCSAIDEMTREYEKELKIKNTVMVKPGSTVVKTFEFYYPKKIDEERGIGESVKDVKIILGNTILKSVMLVNIGNPVVLHNKIVVSAIFKIDEYAVKSEESFLFDIYYHFFSSWSGKFKNQKEKGMVYFKIIPEKIEK